MSRGELHHKVNQVKTLNNMIPHFDYNISEILIQQKVYEIEEIEKYISQNNEKDNELVNEIGNIENVFILIRNIQKVIDEKQLLEKELQNIKKSFFYKFASKSIKIIKENHMIKRKIFIFLHFLRIIRNK